MRQKKSCFVTMLPGMFMMFIVSSFILWTSPVHKLPWGFGLDLQLAYTLAGDLTVFTAMLVFFQGMRKRREDELPEK